MGEGEDHEEPVQLTKLHLLHEEDLDDSERSHTQTRHRTRVSRSFFSLNVDVPTRDSGESHCHPLQEVKFLYPIVGSS